MPNFGTNLQKHFFFKYPQAHTQADVKYVTGKTGERLTCNQNKDIY